MILASEFMFFKHGRNAIGAEKIVSVEWIRKLVFASHRVQVLAKPLVFAWNKAEGSFRMLWAFYSLPL